MTLCGNVYTPNKHKLAGRVAVCGTVATSGVCNGDPRSRAHVSKTTGMRSLERTAWWLMHMYLKNTLCAPYLWAGRARCSRTGPESCTLSRPHPWVCCGFVLAHLEARWAIPADMSWLRGRTEGRQSGCAASKAAGRMGSCMDSR
jgi:hypothetical protein